MFRDDRALAALIHADRVREIEKRARVRRLAPARIRREPFRRVVGRGIVRFGARLAGDSSLESAGSDARPAGA